MTTYQHQEVNRMPVRSVASAKKQVKKMIDNRPEAAVQRKWIGAIHHSPAVLQLKKLQGLVYRGNRSVQMKIRLQEGYYLDSVTSARTDLKEGEGANPLSNFAVWYRKNKIYYTVAGGPHTEIQIKNEVSDDEHTESIFTERIPCPECYPALKNSKVKWNTYYYYRNRTAGTKYLADWLFDKFGWIIWHRTKITKSEFVQYLETNGKSMGNYWLDDLNAYRYTKVNPKKK